MLDAGSGRIVNISMNHTTMTRQGFVPYGPSRAGAEALSRIMAADLADSPVRVNMLLPGGATDTGMVPSGDRPAGLTLLDPAVMGPPIVWLASPQARDVHDERIVATDFQAWLPRRGQGASRGSWVATSAFQDGWHDSRHDKTWRLTPLREVSTRSSRERRDQ